jgi:hypothetical protein
VSGGDSRRIGHDDAQALELVELPAILADAASFVVSGLLIGSISQRYEPPQEPTQGATTRRSELHEGARYIFADPYLRPSCSRTRWQTLRSVFSGRS